VLISPRRAADPVLRRALTPLIGAIPIERMRVANFMVDRPSDKTSPKQAARFLSEALWKQ
jgi:osmoprotectant transport system permease protein